VSVISEHVAAIVNLTKAKPAPATYKCGCGKSLRYGEKCEKCDAPDMSEDTSKSSFFVPIAKANDEEQTVTGVVLQPEVTDGQGDIYDAAVIKEAAYNYLMNYNKQTELGLQHKEFVKGRFALVESYLAPLDIALGKSVVKAGSWIMTVKVLDSKIWKSVKDGKITGFSIGGKAKVQQLKK